jgi:hypothetical protein
MARAVQLPRPLPTRRPEEAPARDRDLIPDSVLRALVKELEEPAVTERPESFVRDPDRRPLPDIESQRVRYHYD